MSKYTSAQAEAIKKYREKNKYIELRCRVSEEERDKIKAHAEKKDGGSMNKFIKRAIDETMERDNNSS